MALIVSSETRAALQALGAWTDDRVDNGAFAKLLAQRLEAQHVAGNLDDIAAVEVTIGQLVSGLIGHSDETLIDYVKPLLGTGARGRVQTALSNGYLLCGKRARLTIDIEGEHKAMTVSTRFLSGDHDVLDRYVLEPRQRRADSLVNSTIALKELVVARQPDMAPRCESFLEQLTITWSKQLQAGAA